MRLAAAVKLPVAPIEPRCIQGRTFLLVERYDREIATDGGVRRLHQEDFCQALGIAPENKYASEGGPGFRQCFDLVRRACTAPAPAILRLLDAAIFNALVGNADAHGKNFSLLYRPQTVELAPLYDLLCTAAYPEVSAKFSMKIAKRANLDEFRPDTWDEFAKDVGSTPTYIRRRVPALAAAMIAQVSNVVKKLSLAELDADALASYGEIVRRRAKRFAT
jgi:serine/threonine-protein kinase HipA